MFLLGSITAWRNAALYCLFVPILTMVAVCFVSATPSAPSNSRTDLLTSFFAQYCLQIPETPLWLLSKDRKEDALKSLQWLRGWVSSKAVEKEFAEIVRYNEYSKACPECVKSAQKCPHPPPTVVQKLKELIRKRTLKPFFVLLIVFFISQFSGMQAMRPYIILILTAYGTPISPNWATVSLGVTGIVGTITCVLTVKLIGKRKLFLISLVEVILAGSALSECYLCITNFTLRRIFNSNFLNCRHLRILSFAERHHIVQYKNRR